MVLSVLSEVLRSMTLARHWRLFGSAQRAKARACVWAKAWACVWANVWV